MRTKLTLSLDDALVRRAKAYAREEGTTVARIVAGLFAGLGEQKPGETSGEQLPPITRSLLGALKGADVREEDYVDHLEEKHR